MNPVGIALGSNLGDREAHLATARDRLRELHEGEPEDFRIATTIETEPIDCAPGTPSFLNTVLELQSSLKPLEILDFCQQIEQEAGRPAEREKNSPRTVDVDILYVGDLEMDTERLILPHPEMQNRDFVLVPLQEIRPDRA
ncbi:MAG: 2-amino-4-hydroxy-6-hydroxymethyldihydropteridine diphosphokinase [Verrucomicrobiales bacterium]|nr:2-amino-4-hydroxy-6-hydroxymethyldihydropteridine diphosphokinase [Verrucomicrobiales bacterium]